MLKSVYLLYECDSWHSDESLTNNNLLGVASDIPHLHHMIIERLRIGWRNEIRSLIESGKIESEKKFAEQVLDDFVQNRNQTQGLSVYLGVEFHAEEVDLDYPDLLHLIEPI